MISPECITVEGVGRRVAHHDDDAACVGLTLVLLHALLPPLDGCDIPSRRLVGGGVCGVPSGSSLQFFCRYTYMGLPKGKLALWRQRLVEGVHYLERY